MADNWENALFNDEPLFPARRDAWNEVAALGTGVTAEERLQEQRALINEHSVVEEEQMGGAVRQGQARPPAQQQHAAPARVLPGVYRHGHISTSDDSSEEAEAVHHPIHVGVDPGWSEGRRGRRRSSARSDKSPKKKSSRRKSSKGQIDSGGAKGRNGDGGIEIQDSASDVVALVGDRKDGYQRLTPHGSGVAGGINLLGTTATHARMCLSCAVLSLAFFAHQQGLAPALLGQVVSLVLLMRCTHCLHSARAYLREKSASMGYKKPPAFTLSDTCASAWGLWAGVLADTFEFVLLVCLCCATVVLGGEGLLWWMPAMSTLARSVIASQVACCFAFFPRLRYASHSEFWCQALFSVGILSLLAGQSGGPSGVTIAPLVNGTRPVNATAGGGVGGQGITLYLPGFDGALSWKGSWGLAQAVSLCVCACAAALRGTWAVILPMRDGEGADGVLGTRTSRKALGISFAWQSALAFIGATSLSFSVTQCARGPPDSRTAAQGAFLLALSQIANFGTQITPTRALLERNMLGRMFVPRAGGLGFARALLRGLFRACLVVVIVLAAATCPRFASWVALAGALGGVPCAIVLPSALSLSSKSSICAKLLDLLVLVSGVMISIVGFSKVYQMLHADHDWGVAKLGWA